MCGIAGFQGKGSADDLARMIARIGYRGPDHRATLVHGHTGLAHARLSVIDLSVAAHQPMTDATGDLAIVFNGEIYNYRELRDALRQAGAPAFRTDSDTEVLLALYRAEGSAMLAKLNGMFALAIHDRRSDELFLARDRMGKKPLHYAAGATGFVFGSELKAVQAHPGVSGDIDPLALHQYLGFEYVPTPRSMLRDVRKLRPGHCLRVRQGRVVSEKAWWQPNVQRRAIGAAEARERLDLALAGATTRRLVADVPLGVFLSGGIDSSTVAWYAQRASAAGLNTFSVGFTEPSYDESAAARAVARHLGTTHHEQILTARDCLDAIPALYATLDEPLADASLIPTFLLCRSARRSVTVCLGGDGSDELFAGYPTFHADRFRSAMASLPRPLLRALQALASRLPASDADIAIDFRVQQFLRGFEVAPRHTHSQWLGSFTPAEKRALLHPDLLAAVAGRTGFEPVDELLREHPRVGGLAEVELVYLLTYLLDDILVKVDRASMYNGLEVRAPFLDVAVVELATSLPDDLKRRGASGKLILKDLMRGRLPDSIIDRPKKGFGIPLAAWLRGELRPLLLSLLAPERRAAEGFFAAGEVERLTREHLSGRANHRKRLWTLLAFQLWRSATTDRSVERLPGLG